MLLPYGRVHKCLNIKKRKGKNEKSRLGLTLIRPLKNENRIWMNMINFKRFILECQLSILLLKGVEMSAKRSFHLWESENEIIGWT